MISTAHWRQSWDLAWALAWKQIKQNHHQGILRAAWVIAEPLISVTLLTFVFSRVAGLPSEGLSYPLFVLAAWVPWTLFAGWLRPACVSLTSNSNLITRIRFPRIVIPIACSLSAWIQFAVSALILCVMMTAYHVPLTWHILQLIPILAIQVVFGCGMVWILSIANAYIRDIQAAAPILLQIWLLITPVAYSLDRVPESIRPWYMLNPMAVVTDSYRRIMLHQTHPDISELMTAAMVSAAVWAIGYAVFKRMEPALADVI